jgi:hypothetical protein
MYTLIEHKKLDTAAASITFSNIPQNFTDLYLMVSLRNDTNNDEIGLLLNGSSSNFSQRSLRGEGTTVLSQSRTTNSLWLGATKSPYTANTFGNCQLYIPNYTSSANKSLSFDSSLENNATDGRNGINAILWSVTDAITSIELDANANFAQNSSATLYGITRTSAIGRPKAIGGNITYANGYWVHTFTGSGTFATLEDLEVEYLVVAGGGGGSYPGGGGAGGYRSTVAGELSGGNTSGGAAVPVSKGTSVGVLVGAGGNGGASLNGSNGAQSIFGAIISEGGGGGGREPNNGSTGGSGGGGAFTSSTTGSGSRRSGGAGTSGQGFAGGYGEYNGTPVSGGGGGGAGAVGNNYGGPANGGAGVYSSITGTYTPRGGGGGGAYRSVTAPVGGLGGGGNGALLGSTGGSGTANTGGGGGGGSTGGNGGSGVVIVRYRAD